MNLACKLRCRDNKLFVTISKTSLDKAILAFPKNNLWDLRQMKNERRVGVVDLPWLHFRSY